MLATQNDLFSSLFDFSLWSIHRVLHLFGTVCDILIWFFWMLLNLELLGTGKGKSTQQAVLWDEFACIGYMIPQLRSRISEFESLNECHGKFIFIHRIQVAKGDYRSHSILSPKSPCNLGDSSPRPWVSQVGNHIPSASSPLNSGDVWLTLASEAHVHLNPFYL